MENNNLPYSEMTLEEALAAFRREHDLEDKYRDMSAEAQAQFERHDIVHVLFGLNTSLRQEAQADGWTLAGSDISWADIRAFMKLPEEQDLISELGIWAIVKGYFAGLPDYARIFWRSRRLQKKWYWSDNASYRQRKVADIRAEFGIDQALAA